MHIKARTVTRADAGIRLARPVGVRRAAVRVMGTWAIAVVLCCATGARVSTAEALTGGTPAPSAPDAWAKPPERLLDAESLAEGRRLFVVHCSSCHALWGGGGIGPNLTDSLVIHGARYADMLRVISTGVEEKGMPRWIGKLGPLNVEIVAAYVFSLWGTKPDDPADSDPNRKPRIRFSVIVWMPGARLLMR